MLANSLTRSTGRKAKANQKGRGNGSKGTYSGKGLKGQKARSGASISLHFEGGQTPLVKRLPKKRGFTRHPKLIQLIHVINLRQLEADAGISSEVTPELLIELGYGDDKGIFKILGNGDLSKKLKFSGITLFSKSARQKIEAAGGSVELPAPAGTDETPDQN